MLGLEDLAGVRVGWVVIVLVKAVAPLGRSPVSMSRRSRQRSSTARPGRGLTIGQTMSRWKPALKAFAVIFEGRLFPIER